MKGSKDAIRTARGLIKVVTVDGRIDPSRVKRVVARIGDAKPRGYLGILGAFQRMVRLEVEKRVALIETATELKRELREALERNLKAKYGGDLVMEFGVDESLIGGMRVRVGSDVWDGSVKGRLARLADKVS